MSSLNDKGSTRRWREIRDAVLRRDGYRCRAHNDGHCDVVVSKKAHRCRGDGMVNVTHAHHTKGRRITGDDMRYIVASCEDCNLYIGDPSKHSPPVTTKTKW